jgi:hypothetical protein
MLRRPVAVILAASALVATLGASVSPAEAQWRRGGYYYGPAVVGGALLGLGVGALLTAPYYARPPVVYAPPYYPPAYAYAPPPYAYAPAPYYRY